MPTRLRLAFAGTPEFAVPHLAACRNPNVEIVAVYTQPDRPAGRGRQVTPSPVKRAALELGLVVEQPETLRDPQAQQRLRDLRLDLLVVVAYGLILPRKVLAAPRLGCWNVHASLLPRWRGAAPIQRALLAGDGETGVCLMQMEAGLDTGPVLLRQSLQITATDTGGSLHDRLAVLGADVLAAGLRHALLNEAMPPQPQAETGASYARKLEKSEAVLDWSEPAAVLERKVRAFIPWPVAEAQVAGERLRIWSAQALNSPSGAAPGSVIAARRDGIDLACGDGVLRITRIQRAGGKPMAVSDYPNARTAAGKTAS